MPKILFRDYETRGTVDLVKAGSWQYSTHPQTDVWCCAFAVDDGEIKLWVPGDQIPAEFIKAAANPEYLVSAFNDSFEGLIEQHIMGPRYGWPAIPLERHRCLQAAALALALPAKLEGAARALNLEQQKDVAGHKLMLQMAKPRRPRRDEDPANLYWFDDPDRVSRLHGYCRQDVETERALHARIGLLSAEEQALWQLDAIINERGIHIDGELLEAAIGIGTAALREINDELQAITAGEVTSVNQTDALLKWLAARDCVVTSIRKSTLRRALTSAKLLPEARRAIQLRLDGAHAAVAKLATMRDWCNGDGRARYTFRYHGASTGRWTSHGIQLQNMKRPEVEDLAAAIAAVANGDLNRLQQQFSQPMSVIGDITRALICAEPGHRLIAADFSGIESRVTAWLSGQQSKLDQWAKFDSTQDPQDEPYFMIGHKIFGLPAEQARSPGKTGDLAFGFMGGQGAWQKLAPTGDTSTEEEVKRRKQAWRNAHRATVRFWYDLNRAAVRAVEQPGAEATIRALTFCCDDSFLRLKLPSGRMLAYPFPRLITNERGDPVVVFMDNQIGKWVECRHGLGAYGGTWIENAVQAVARDLFAAAMPRLEAAGYGIVLHVHDEIVAEVPNDFGSADEFLRIITTAPNWADGLPIAAKVREGERFCKISTPGAGAAPTGTTSDTAAEAEHKSDPLGDHKCGPDTTPGHDAATEAGTGTGDTGDAGKDHQDGADPDYPDNGETGHPGKDDGGDGGHNGGSNDGYTSGERPGGSSSAVYIYRDANGAPYLRVLRTAQKQFPQFHWDNGRWLKGKPAGPKIPYRLPELLAAAADVPIFICEGEKDTDNVTALGLIATTNSEGAGKGKWTADMNSWFAGKQTVYILEDNDEDGRRHAREVASNLQHIVAEIRVVSFSELPPKADVSDWLNTGGTKEQLLERAKTAPRAMPDGYVLVRASDIVPRAMDWLWQGHILRGSQELLTGVPGGGKSQIHCAFVAYVTTGGAWPDGCNGAPAGNVIMLTAEDCLDQTIVPRLIAAGANRERVFILKKIRKDNKERMFLLSEDLEQLAQMITKTGDVRLITIDPITAYMGHKLDSHRATDVRGQLGPLADLAERSDVALSAITHPPKHTTQRAIDHFIGSQAFIAAARIGHMSVEEVDEDEHGNRAPTGRSLFTNPKNNVSRKMPTLAYRIIEKPLDGDIKAPFVTWEEIVDITADQAVAASMPSKERGRQSDCIVFLMNTLANGPALIATIEEQGAALGFSKDQLDRAKRKMGVVAFKERGKFDGPWFWALPQHATAKETT
jgi:DNA polymerase bacteriophage-type